MYKAVSNRPAFPEMEREILALWKQEQTFAKSLELRKNGPEFVFYDGPPFATGLPHYGHLLAGTIKDVIPRYQAMRGHYVDRRFGWDCHGLPVEYEVEQDLNISGKTEIETLGVDVFNERCRSIVLRYTQEWEAIVTRMGRWVDFERDYKTMDPTYMESIWWVFQSLWKKQLIYEGQKILPYCPRCATPLSNFETNQGYADVKDPAITVRFQLCDAPNTYILAWTTTPWTLPSNMALAVGADIPYARVTDNGAVYYLAKDRLDAYYRNEEEYESVDTVVGSELVGMTYQPLFPYFAEQRAAGAFRVVAADFVSTNDGTGVVHIAPGFGEDDHRLGQEAGIPAVCPVDAEGLFTDDVTDYAGRNVKEADSDIIRFLKEQGMLIKKETITHSYPHCWRCDTPLIYRGISTWFVRVEQIRDRLIEANQTIQWVPGHLRDGRFGKWLEGARDWAISRNRYWGTPLPIWRSEDGEETVCIGSIKELSEACGTSVADLHKHIVDDLTIPSKHGNGVLRRVPEVLDCWFESGSMPYAQAHYPFENKEHFERHFPADFIAEGLDQTRGWFYTLMVLSVALFDRPAFRNVVVNGLVLAGDGKKMSKRLRNYPDPASMIESYGADALRLYMLHSPVVRAEDLCFTEDGVKHLMRHILIPWWNAYAFFVTYANIDGWQPPSVPPTAEPPNVLDRWIESSLESLTETVTAEMDAYELQRAIRPFVAFIDDLTNWYIRRSRRRFWKSQDDTDKQQAYQTLHRVLLQLSHIAAPFVPFISDCIYRALRTEHMPDSVHLCDFPCPNAARRDETLESDMATVMTVVRLGRQLRTENDLKVRQPLSALHVVSRDTAVHERLEPYRDIILDELNVKQLIFDDQETKLADLTAKPDFKRMGPRFGANMKVAAAATTAMGSDLVERLAEQHAVTISIDGKEETLAPDDVIIARIPKPGMVCESEGALLIALATELSDDLIKEGLAREFVNKVQNMRKTADLDVADRIDVVFSSNDAVTTSVLAHADYVKGETLTTTLSPDGAGDTAEEWDLNGHACSIRIQRVTGS